MFLRNYGAYEQGGCFAILLISAFSPLIDRVVLYGRREVLRRGKALGSQKQNS